MELVDGRQLSNVIPSDGLPLESVVRYGMQIADALGHAHDRGVVHRDLKGANVLVTTEGRAKILDFGIATRHEPHNQDATQTSGLDQPGVVAGTLPYMAPEVLRGEGADARSDVWALGVLLYEMATGRRPFRAPTSAELTSVILRDAPPPLSPGTPGGLAAIVQRCLSKDVTHRYQRAGEVRAALETMQPAITGVVPLAPARSRSRLGYLVAAVVFIGVLVVAGILPRLGSNRPSTRPSEFVQLTNFTDSVHSPALSPDGRMLAFLRGPDTFAGPGDIYVKLLPDGEPVQLTHDGSKKFAPVFSPDGSTIAYSTGAQGSEDTWTVPVLGGSPRLLLANASGLTWVGKGDRRVMFSEVEQGLYMKVATSSEGRAEERDVYRPPATGIGMAHRSALSPDGLSVIVVEMNQGQWLPCRVVPFDGGSAGRQVGPSPAKCTHAAWSPDGVWMYLSADVGAGFHLWRQRFPDGAPEQMTFGPTQEEGVAVTPDGRFLVTAVGIEQNTIWLHDSRQDRQISSAGYAYMPTLSPDGQTLFYLTRGEGTLEYVAGELRAVDLASGQSERLLREFSIAATTSRPTASGSCSPRWTRRGNPPCGSHRSTAALLSGV